MKRQDRRFPALCRAVFAAVLVLVLTGANLVPAAAVTWADVNDLKNEANSLDAEKKELQDKLDALADDKSEAMARKQLLDQQIANTEAQIANVQAQINQYAALITQTEQELTEAQEQEEAQYELFCSRVREMEKQGEVSYWAVLFRATSFTDLLGRLDAVNEVMKYDQGVINDLKDLQAEIEEKKTTLETSKTESESAKAELVSKQSELNTQRSQANAVIQQLSANESETEGALADLEAQQDALWAEAQRLSDQLVAQQAAAGQSTESNPGGYIWPVDSRYITSTVGGRASPGGIGSTNHKGTDIGRVGYTHLRLQGGHRHRVPVLQLLRQLRGHLPRQRQHHPVRPYVQPEGVRRPVCEPGRCHRHHRLHRQLHRTPSAF